MRIDRLRIIVFSIAVITAMAVFGFFVQVNVRDFRSRLAGQRSHEQQEVDRMQTEITRLRQLQQELSNAGFVTDDALAKERVNAQRIQKKIALLIAQNKSLLDTLNMAQTDKRSLSQSKGQLDKTIDDLTVQNAGLQKEIELLRRNFDVALQVRSRLAQVQESMAGLIIQKGKENILEMQLDALTREVDDIHQYLIEIRDNRISPKLVLSGDQEQAASGRAKKSAIDPEREISYLEQVNDLKARINILTSDNAVLKEKYLMAQDSMDQHKKVFDAGNQKIYSLEARLIEAESGLSQSKTRYQDLERTAASLRERYVANELEKEGLKIKLNQLTAELNDVRGKFLALLGKISDIFQSPGPEISPGQRRDLKSIIGVELFPNATDKQQ